MQTSRFRCARSMTGDRGRRDNHHGLGHRPFVSHGEVDPGPVSYTHLDVYKRQVWWRDIGVTNLPSGRPTFELTGGAKRRLEAITPAGYQARIDLTMTDEGPMAQALVIISATAIPGH